MKNENMKNENMIDRLKELTRGELIGFLEWNDSNGCYSDDESRAEGLPPCTSEELLNIAIAKAKEQA